MIIIAPDKFKGTLTAAQAAEAIAAGLRDAGFAGELLCAPMADGGDGTAAVLSPLLRPGECVVESHSYIGPESFAETPPGLRSSHAMGTAIASALRSGHHVLAGIGGTACCDGGAGMLQALGMRAFRADGSLIAEPLSPSTLPLVAHVDLSALPAPDSITVLSDVRASLVPDSSTALSALDFARQKGFATADIPALSAALERWSSTVCSRRSPIDGAGGGIGFAFASVMGCASVSGAEFIASRYALPMSRARLVISGEGCIDAQTGGGKVVAELAARAARAGVPFLAVGGIVSGRHPYPVIAANPPGAPVPATQEQAARILRSAVAAQAKRFLNALI